MKLSYIFLVGDLALSATALNAGNIITKAKEALKSKYRTTCTAYDWHTGSVTITAEGPTKALSKAAAKAKTIAKTHLTSADIDEGWQCTTERI